jgi:hypothetical protein
MKYMKLNKRKIRFLLVLPAVGVLFLCLVFYLLHGGRGKPAGAAMGLNTQLPKPRFDPRQAFLNKMQVYAQADRDSLRREQYERQDPYRMSDSVAIRKNGSVSPRPIKVGDQKADELLRQLDKLQKSIRQPSGPPVPGGSWTPPPAARPIPLRDTVTSDPKVDRLNLLLDKVIRIQHPGEDKPETTIPMRAADEVQPADPGVNTIAAVVPEDQTLTAGATIALRITDSIHVNGRLLPAGQLVYGTVNIQNDRMQVHIGALRDERNLYTIDLQVYDLDGLAGIHMPGMLSRDVAKQSADQGVNSLNVLNMDPSLGAQAASAGIQTVKSFVGHKVRQVRVSVRAGYQVLLRPVRLEHGERPGKSADLRFEKEKRPPGFVPDGPIIKRCRSEGMELSLRGVWLEESCLWFGLEWVNRTAIVYRVEYARWFVRDRRVLKRTAVQELPMEAVNEVELPAVGQDSVCHSWVGFKPFALAKDKELVLEVDEKGGGRVLQLVIDHRELLHAKRYGKETEP